MNARLLRRRHSRLAAQGGFMMIEVLIATLILTVGLLGLIGAFDSARKLNLLSERRTEMAHRAQLEIERLQAKPYAELEMKALPSSSTEPTNPDYYVKTSTSEYQYGSSSSEAEKLVIATTATEKMISATPTGRSCSTYVGACEWKDGLLSGNVYDFITWHTDGKCGAGCPTSKNYKRLTVAVTVTVGSGSHTISPVRVSTLVAEA
jgi:Tfp pilus assembly protein PilV